MGGRNLLSLMVTLQGDKGYLGLMAFVVVGIWSKASGLWLVVLV